ncbi:Plasmodium exported protein, unknown function [Plasmodium knowlesi strain H]|uniref:Uncharacterized protein n=3 Tax=Plasmodium knowlesi TaxID=5850 RepID=A0A5K1VK33_PLAKH|nr:Plasmodium exported protein, unknown function [Plasmodium knowlesi strain H]OTN64731.1 Uncharacterized protein PKNOH_S130215800 [Plasmodium knowlesi]CAA9989318.1 Plasmodium exported protein, unknown function [Plasmodium knowlesi strain H]SBO26107.1 Plasmodium exported protein, unknown function [Plasmodium knowlesi strain H]SBO26759.1 Plasmodium exported protein, unknown function [Plasmodium knowlesi strain H]VVS78792.1 Plasmodium exported protein, unknown function [Plasmodium knowlesi strai|eukprot:XP_002261665.1 hypothetical protein, conserved in Plasmodium species [Plasmodium knowlesi strain H]
MNTFNHIVKIALFTLFIYTSANNGIKENGFGKAEGKRNIRCLTEMNREFGRQEFGAQGEQGQFVNGENTNERRNRNRGGFDSQNDRWNNSYQGQPGPDPQMHERIYRNTDVPEYYNSGSNIRYVSPGNNFNNELFEKLKNNAIFIIPALLLGFYALRNMGTNSLLMIVAIVGILMYTQRYIN